MAPWGGNCAASRETSSRNSASGMARPRSIAIVVPGSLPGSHATVSPGVSQGRSSEAFMSQRSDRGARSVADEAQPLKLRQGSRATLADVRGAPGDYSPEADRVVV